MSEPKSILACDVGNTRIALGRVLEEEVCASRRVPGNDAGAVASAMAELLAECPAPCALAACSANAAHLAVLEQAAGSLGRKVLLVGRELDLPIATDLPEPGRIGADRLCAAAMAYHRVRQACVVADFGTAITIDCVSQEGAFLGGAILPGLGMGAEALARGTAVLPKVALAKPDWVFGKDTRQAIVGGLVFGARGALRQLTEQYATHLGHWPLLILTGGDAELIGGGNELVHAIVPELVLMGVALAYRLSVETRPTS
jgi:type III pantothenate kinase